MGGCRKCIVYLVQNNISEPDICSECGEKTMFWKIGETGVPYLKCDNCHCSIGVDQNLPCELDPLINKDVTIIIKPQSELPTGSVVIDMGKIIGINALEMRKGLTEGYSVKLNRTKTEDIIKLFKENDIAYEMEGYVDFKRKYNFYKECRYPYSAMQRIFL